MRSIFSVAALLLCGFAGLSAQNVNPSVFAALHWRSIGPPRSGYVAAPAGVPGDLTTYYVGLPEGGVWKTTNAGTTWQPIFDDVHVASVGAVAVAPSQPSIVYVGTGNQSGWSFTPGKGVYKSTDAGRTWTNVGLEHSQYIGGLIVDPRDPNTVLVAAIGPRAGTGGAAAPEPEAERGVYRTTDGGKTWTRVLDVNSGVSDIYQDYADPKMVFALASGGFGGRGAQTPTPEGTGLYKSSDEGASWQPVTGQGLPDGARISAFAVSSGTHGRRLYAVAAVGGGRGPGRGAASRGLYRSDDGGATWTLGTRALASAGGKMYADPQNPDVVFLMGTAVYKSTDGGHSVAAFWGAPSGADPRFLWIDPTNSHHMIAGVDQGAAISVDGGASWTPYYGLVDGQFYRVATDYRFPYHVCGPQQDSGTACTASRTDFGQIRPDDWYVGGGFENGFLIADPKDARHLYTQGWYHVLRRYDLETGQDVVLYQPTPEDRFGGAPPLAFSNDGRTLYMAAQHVLASDDRGLTWRTVSPDLAAPPNVKLASDAVAGGSTVSGPAQGGSITTFALSSADAGVMWAGASTGLVHVTRDGGKTWTNVTPKDLPPGSINVVDASHHDAGTAYVALLSRDSHPHIFRTTDFGQSWKEIVSGIADDGTARVVREDPADPAILYAGTVTSIWTSFDRGDHWESLQLDLPNTVVSDITIKDADLVISTYGRGFWILDDVSPLRQARAALASSGPAFLFKPEPVWRARWDNTQDTPLPPEMVVGENPLEGAVIDYYLPSQVNGAVKLTFSDARGHTIREFTNVAPAVDTVMPNVPDYWLMPPTVLSTSAGTHRVNWDLRYPDPPTLNYGYSGTLLDYREYTLNWHAIKGKTYRRTLVGPMVVPGTYTVTLSAGGRTYSQPIKVVQDPRVEVPQAGLEAQFTLQQRMVAGITTTYDAVNYVDSLNEAIDKARGGKASPDLDALAKSLGPLTGSFGVFGLAHRDLSRRLNDQLIADMPPTANIIAGVDGPCKTVDEALATIRSMQPTASKLGLPTWTAPASACAAR